MVFFVWSEAKTRDLAVCLFSNKVTKIIFYFVKQNQWVSSLVFLIIVQTFGCMFSVMLLSNFTVCCLTLHRQILQQPLGFVLCVKTLCKTYQSHLWAKLEDSSCLGHLLSWGRWGCQDLQVQALCLSDSTLQQPGFSCSICLSATAGWPRQQHSYLLRRKCRNIVNSNPPATQSSELKTQEKISLKKMEKEKDAEISFCSWGIFLQVDELLKTWDE